MKKAVMFGLDARIVLVILGVLSVITGVALFFVIKDTNVISFIKEIQEFGKVPKYSNPDAELKLNNKNVEKSKTVKSERIEVVKFKKLEKKRYAKDFRYVRYLNYNMSEASMDKLKNKSRMFVAMKNNMQWGGDIKWTEAKCVNSKDCSLWQSIRCSSKDEQFIKDLDKEIDGSDGAKSGSLRWWLKKDSSRLKVFLRNTPIKKPVA